MPWHYRVVVSESTTSVVHADGTEIADPDSGALAVAVDRSNDTVVVTLPRDALGGTPAGELSVVAGIHAESDGTFLPVEESASDSAFGGATSGAAGNAPRITDMFSLFENPQEDALAYSADSRATVPFVPITAAAETAEDVDSGGDGDDGQQTTTTATMTDEPTPDQATTAATETTAAEDGPGFGVLSGVLGTAGGAAYAARQLLDSDGTLATDDTEE
jgi:carbohydrate-binding DOMON domain-containing protein